MTSIADRPTITHDRPANADTASVDSLLLARVRQWLILSEGGVEPLAPVTEPSPPTVTVPLALQESPAPRLQPLPAAREASERPLLPRRHRRPQPRIATRLAQLTMEFADLVPSRRRHPVPAGKHRA